MATPAELQAQLDALNEAIAAGATSISYEGKSVSYRSLSEMRWVRDDLMKQLGLTPTGERRTTVAGYNPGYWPPMDPRYGSPWWGRR